MTEAATPSTAPVVLPVAERTIIAAGGKPARCPIDGTVFDRSRSHDGHKGGRVRDYCSPDCKAAGQGVIPGCAPLPDVPPLVDPVTGGAL